MITTIRTVQFAVDGDTVTPSAPQYAGVQGEHNATQLSFQLPEDWNSAYQYRLEYVDGLQHTTSTPVLEAAEGTVTYLIPKTWTSPGGMGEVRLCAMLLDEQKQEQHHNKARQQKAYRPFG